MPALRHARRAAGALAAVLATVAAAACDTDDGRTMRAPTSDERAVLSTTTAPTTTLLGSAEPGLGGLPGGVGALTTTTLPLVAATATSLASAVSATTAAPASLSLQLPWPDAGVIDARFTCDGAGRSPLVVWSAPPTGTVELALLVTDDDADGFVHWAVAGITPTAGQVAEGATIPGAYEGLNSAGSPGWTGPCPPAGGPHTYRFRLFALSQASELPDGFSGQELEDFAAAVAVGEAQATGRYTRAA